MPPNAEAMFQAAAEKQAADFVAKAIDRSHQPALTAEPQDSSAAAATAAAAVPSAGAAPKAESQAAR